MKDVNQSNIASFIRLVEKSERPVIVTHAKPDGDAIGSSVGMYHFLSMLDKPSRKIVLNDSYPDYLDFVAASIPADDIIIHSSKGKKAEEAIRESDLIICLDFNAFHRTKNLEQALTDAPCPKILIDHHLDPAREHYAVSFSETEISSASELTYWILMGTNHVSGDASRLPYQTCIALMTGMTTDTNNFNNSVFPSTLAMASELLRCGTDRDMILTKINLEHSENRLRLKGFMLKDLMQITEDGVSYMILDKEAQRKYKMKEGDTEGFVNEPLSIASVRMSIFAKEDNHEVRISIRSKKGTSANRCARLFFNGGGHENAAGGKLTIPINEVEEYIKTYTHMYMTEYEN